MADAAYDVPTLPGPRVLIVESDTYLADAVAITLRDDAYTVAILMYGRPESDEGAEWIVGAVRSFQPDCVLLSGPGRGGGYAESWATAAHLAEQCPQAPLVMFSGDLQALAEATEAQTERSRAAHFAYVLSKPFDLDELLRVVCLATARSPRRQVL